MMYTYFPRGVCSVKVHFDLDGDVVRNVAFEGGCHGNLQAVAKLIDGMPVSEVREKLSGIRCGHKPTSCSDQLVRALNDAIGSR